MASVLYCQECNSDGDENKLFICLAHFDQSRSPNQEAIKNAICSMCCVNNHWECRDSGKPQSLTDFKKSSGVKRFAEKFEECESLLKEATEEFSDLKLEAEAIVMDSSLSPMIFDGLNEVMEKLLESLGGVHLFIDIYKQRIKMSEKTIKESLKSSTLPEEPVQPKVSDKSPPKARFSAPRLEQPSTPKIFSPRDIVRQMAFTHQQKLAAGNEAHQQRIGQEKPIVQETNQSVAEEHFGGDSVKSHAEQFPKECAFSTTSLMVTNPKVIDVEEQPAENVCDDFSDDGWGHNTNKPIAKPKPLQETVAEISSGSAQQFQPPVGSEQMKMTWVQSSSSNNIKSSGFKRNIF